MKEIRIPARKAAALLLLASGAILIYCGLTMDRLKPNATGAQAGTRIVYESVGTDGEYVRDEAADNSPERGYASDGVADEPTQGAVNINTASAEELTELPGIGEVRAQAIVDYREQNGWFRSVDELVLVPGIGEKTLEKLRSECTV